MNLFTDIRRTLTANKTINRQTVICVSDCYSIKDELKARGYGWNAMAKRWEKVTEDALEEMTKLFEAKLGTVEDYEHLYTKGVLDESRDFSDEQYNRIAAAIGE